jgi:cell division protein FtsB
MGSTPRPPRTGSTSTGASHLELVDDRPIWSRLTTRAVVLLLVAAALVMSLAFPLREFIAQRAEMGAKERQVALLKSRVATLQEQQDRWQDPAFVEQQARERLHYVFPGETGLILLSPDDVKQAREPEVRLATKPEIAWYDELWTSVQAADQAH